MNNDMKNSLPVRRREIETVLVVSEFVPYQKYSMKSDCAGMTIDFTVSIQSKGLKNVLVRPLFEQILKKEDKDHLVKLTDYTEQQKTE